MNIQLRNMQTEDGPAILKIYEQGLATGIASFQISAPPFEEWDRSHLGCCRIVAETDGRVVGWAALSPVSSRCVYSGVAEVSIYIGDNFRGIGVGSLLMSRLISESETSGIWTLQSSIFCNNTPSIRLHEKFGFRVVGRRERIGYDERTHTWLDTFLMERRSRLAGL